MSDTPNIRPLIKEAARHFGTIHALFIIGDDDAERSVLVSRYLGVIADEVGHVGLFAISCAAVASIIPPSVADMPDAIFKLEQPDNLPDNDTGRSVLAVGQFVAAVSGSDLDTAWAIFLGWVPEDVLAHEQVPESVGWFFGGLMSMVCHTHLQAKTEPKASADQRRRLLLEAKHQVHARARRRGRRR